MSAKHKSKIVCKSTLNILGALQIMYRNVNVNKIKFEHNQIFETQTISYHKTIIPEFLWKLGAQM